MTQPRAGFLLTRHWRDTPQGTELSFWLATDDGPLQVTLPPQESVAFIPEAQRAQAERLLQGGERAPLRPAGPERFPPSANCWPLLPRPSPVDASGEDAPRQRRHRLRRRYPPAGALSDGALYHRPGVGGRRNARLAAGQRTHEAEP